VKFGTVVVVERGSKNREPGTPGSLRLVKGVLVGALGPQRRVRLLEDDPLDTVGWSKRGHIGWWGSSVVRAQPAIVSELVDERGTP